MLKIDRNLRDNNGSILVVAMLVLLILTLIGIAATNTSNIEMRITGNETAYKSSFYDTDAGVSWAVASLDQWSVSDLAVGDTISTGGVYPFQLTYRGEIPPIGEEPLEIEVQSNSLGGQGNVSIVAGIRLPTVSGALGGTGDQGEY